MRIEIAKRMRPYSHVPGTYFVLPGSTLRLQIFPALINVDDLSETVPKLLATVTLDVEGPVADFTVQQDLERGCIVIWGRSKKGYFRYKIVSAQDGASVLFAVEKHNLNLKSKGERTLHPLADNQYVLGKAKPSSFVPYVPSSDNGRLFLGNNKSEDWTLMRRRLDLTEILPLWHRLGQMVPRSEHKAFTSPFLDLFLAHFDFALSPRLVDTDYQGIHTTKLDGSPLQILVQGADSIRALFVQTRGEEVHILPELPQEFHCGRFLNVACGSFGRIDLEWSKKAIRRAIFRATRTYEIVFVFYDAKTHCRIRTSHKDKGTKYISGNKFSVSAGTTYWLDNFQK